MTFLFTKSYRNSSRENTAERTREKQVKLGNRLHHEIVQKSILYLAKNRDYDEILYILINKSINVQDWITLHETTSPFADTSSIREKASSGTTHVNDSIKASVSIDRRRKSAEDNAYFVLQLQQDSVLHLILKYNPPVEIIDLLIERMLEYKSVDRNDDCGVLRDNPIVPEVILDTQGRTPLHVAAAIGSSYDIVLRLVGRGTHQDLSTCPAFIKDSMGRYALHWVCTNPSSDSFNTKSCLTIGTKSESKIVDNYNIYKIVQLLVQINPGSVVERDIYDETPLAIAKRHGVKDDIVEFLETAVVWVEQSIREHKKRRDQQFGTEEKCDDSSELFTCNTSLTTSITKMTSCNDIRKENSIRSIPSQLPLFMYNSKSTIPRFVGMFEGEYTKKDQQVKSNRVPCQTSSIPSEIYQSKKFMASSGTLDEDVEANVSTEFVEIEDDISSVGSGGITTFALPWRPKAFSQIDGRPR
jgi:hypothetical protein